MSKIFEVISQQYVVTEHYNKMVILAYPLCWYTIKSKNIVAHPTEQPFSAGGRVKAHSTPHKSQLQPPFCYHLNPHLWWWWWWWWWCACVNAYVRAGGEGVSRISWGKCHGNALIFRISVDTDLVLIGNINTQHLVEFDNMFLRVGLK